jgi:S-adenosylmethionine/arginine decarboxylase-like enzyme
MKVSLDINFLCLCVLLLSALAFQLGRMASGTILRQKHDLFSPNNLLPELLLSHFPFFAGEGTISGTVDDEDEEDDDDDDAQLDENGAEAFRSRVKVPPTGILLHMDVNGIDSNLLESQDAVLEKIHGIVQSLSSEVFSSRCHTQPHGYSCGFLLSKGHSFIHVWPKSGVINLDIFQGGGAVSLLSLVSVVQDTFEVDVLGVNSVNRWAHKFRGKFYDSSLDESAVAVISDLFAVPISEYFLYQSDMSL